MRVRLRPHPGRYKGSDCPRCGAHRIRNGQWLSFATTLPDTGLAVSWNFFLAMTIMGVIVLAISAWAVRRVTAPLSLLAKAAERLGKDVGADPLPELGTTEMRHCCPV
jgi:hypothetical protein